MCVWCLAGACVFFFKTRQMEVSRENKYEEKSAFDYFTSIISSGHRAKKHNPSEDSNSHHPTPFVCIQLPSQQR